ncbi:hypothetical protein [Streptomyces mirabilis]|uniref:hypothetical protein n=1 Tax=Streptomyces mirabilis TaxID=68239 RepID=UPI0035DC0877
MLVELGDVVVEVRGVGDVVLVAAAFMAAQDADDGAGVALGVVVGEPGAAARAALEVGALDAQLGVAEFRGVVLAGDRGVAAGGVAGDLDLVVEAAVCAEAVAAQDVLDVLAVLRADREEGDVEGAGRSRVADRPARCAAAGALEGPDRPGHLPVGRPVTAPAKVGNYAVLIIKIVGNYAALTGVP